MSSRVILSGIVMQTCSIGVCNRSVPEPFLNIMSAFQDVLYLRAPTPHPSLYPHSLEIIVFYTRCALVSNVSLFAAALSRTLPKPWQMIFAIFIYYNIVKYISHDFSRVGDSVAARGARVLKSAQPV